MSPLESGYAALALLVGCSGPGTSTNESADELATLRNGVEAAASNQSTNDDGSQPAIPIPEPGDPGGLDDDRTPISEAPFAKTSAQGAASRVQTYYALLEQAKFGEALSLHADTNIKPAEFAARFQNYAEYHANVGAPGTIEGAAGSLYVEVPVLVYGRRKDGSAFNQRGSVIMRRSNQVPGSTAEQQRWRIASINLDGAKAK